MKITPLDIHQKKFKTGFKGYNVDEVDRFLDEISAQLDEMFRENSSLKEQVVESETIVNKYKGLEQAMNKALISAGKLSDEITLKAKMDAEKIIADAKTEARNILETSNKQRKELLKNIKRLQRLDEKCKNRLLVMLDDFVKETNNAEAIVEENVIETEDNVTAQLEEYIRVNIDSDETGTAAGSGETSEVISEPEKIEQAEEVEQTKDVEQAEETTSSEEEGIQPTFNIVSEEKSSIPEDGESAFADLGEGVPGVIKRKRNRKIEANK